MYQRLLYRYQHSFSAPHRDAARLIPLSFLPYVKLHGTVLANDIWVEVMPVKSGEEVVWLLCLLAEWRHLEDLEVSAGVKEDDLEFLNGEGLTGYACIGV